MQGIRLRAYPTDEQKLTLSAWMGCAKTIWNAKCAEERYMSSYSRKYYPIGTYAPIDQTYSQYKNKELTPWLFDCPSQVLRNSAVNWYDTYWKFIKGECGKPKIKTKSSNGSVYLTKELFKFVEDGKNNVKLYIGTKKYNVGILRLRKHRKFLTPKSITIKKLNGRYYVSFCFGDKQKDINKYNKDNLKYLNDENADVLESITVGVDRGIKTPIQTNSVSYDFSKEQKTKLLMHKRYIKRLQRRLAKQNKGGVRYKRTKQRIANRHQSISNTRKDFCHKSSHSIVADVNNKVIVLEDLKITNMTKSAKGTLDKPGKSVKAKSGLNREILDKGWHLFETYISYKSQKYGKAYFKVNPKHTSQECNDCGYIHPDNRKEQSKFFCINCGNIDNADVNAAKVIAKRAIRLIKDSGTELSKRGVLTPSSDKGRGDANKTSMATALGACISESSKKKVSTELNTLH